MPPDFQDIKNVADELGTKFDEFRNIHGDRVSLIEKELMDLMHLKRPGGGGLDTGNAIHGKSALRAYIKGGDASGLIALQGKSMSTGSDPDGG